MPRWLTISLSALVVMLVVYVAIAPIGPLPGIRLGGNPATAPENWSSVELPGEILLKAETGGLPRVVTIWVVEYDNELYVSGMKESGWVQAAIKHPNVEVRINDQAYRLNAQQLKPIDPKVYTAYVDRYKDEFADIVAAMPSVDEVDQVGAAFRLAR